MSSRARRIVAGAIAATLVAGLAGCASGGESEDSKSINVYLPQHAWTESISDLIPEFEEKTGVKVNLTTLGESQLAQQYQVMFNAGSSDADVAMVKVSVDKLQFDRNGWLTDLSDRVTEDSDWGWDDFSEVSRDAVSNADGQVLGVPLVSERSVLIYRKDLLDTAGLEVPSTFDELEAAADALTDADAGQYGFVARGKSAAAVPTVSSYVYGYGSDWDKDGEALVSADDTVAGIRYFGNLLAKYGPPGTLNMDWPEATAVFQQGKAAMTTEVDALFANYIDPEASRVVDQVGFAPFPAGPGGHRASNIVPWALTIPSGSEKADLAWQFVQWATSKTTSKTMLSQNNPVTRDSAWADPEASSAYPAELAKVIQEPGDIEYVDHTSPRVTNVSKSRDIIGTVIATAIDGGDVKGAADAANNQLQELIDSEK